MTGRRSAVLGLALLFAGLLLVALPSPASAATLAQKKAQARTIMKQLDELDVKMEIAVEQYNAAAGKLAAVNEKIRENERNLTIARYNLLVAKDTLESRAVAMYKQQPVDLLDVVLATSSFDELITQLDMLNRLGQSDIRVVDSIAKYEGSIEDAQTALGTDRRAAERLLAERTSQKQVIERALQQRKSLLKGVEDQIADLERRKAVAGRQAAAKAGVLPVSGGVNPGPGHGGVVAVAMQYLGVPYQYGGASPSTGFDCSGFTMFVYSQVGVSLPHNAAAQYGCCTPVPKGQEQPGDLVFFGAPIHHVGLYVGGGMMIHAPHPGAVVQVDAVYSDYVGAGRP